MIVEILSGYASAIPTQMQLDAWIDTYRLRVTTVADIASTGVRTIPTYDRRESLYIVDLRTMRIVNKYLGDTSGRDPPSVRTAVPRMLELLRM